MSERACKHPDIREFDGLSCCLACGETVLDDSVLVPTNQIVDTEDHYRYASLNYNRGLEIRLIELLPGETADPIRCEIIHVNLEDSPDYDAVSYTWATESGDDSLCKTIQVLRGGSMLITANCDVALRQLRRRGLRRRLWIDAICIDQSKIKERNHQVNLMDHIYSLATSVRICVQDPIARSSGIDYSALFRRFGQTLAHEPAAVNHRPPPYDYASLISQLLTRRYFKRIWVIQEVVLARAAYLVLNDEELLLTSAVLEGMISICSYQLGGERRPPPSILSWRANHDTTSSILTCLYASMHCEMTDPRDGIYAVLSLMEPRSRSLISVNYASTVESVYANAIAANISTHQDLAVLSYVGVGISTSPGGNTSSSPVTSARRWQTAMCLDMARLRLFVLDNSGSKLYDPVSHFIPKPLPPQFGTHSIGAWRRTVDIGVASPEDYYQEIISGSHACLVELPRPTHTDFLPRIRIQAHYIDSVDQTVFSSRDRTVFSSQWGVYLWNIPYYVLSEPSCLKLVDFSWLAALLGGSPETSSGVSDKDWYKYQDHHVHVPPLETWLLMAEEANLSISGPNLTEIWTFFSRMYLLKGQFFLSHFSVGYVQTSIQTGDEIFAVDGVGSPLVLRKTGVNQYRIVTECWLLAALELDCWNPGTKKGRWGEDVKRPTETQTRMIEIY